MASKALEVRRHNETLLQVLEPGDLVEFPRGAYSHWAVYIGMYCAVTEVCTVLFTEVCTVLFSLVCTVLFS